MNTIRNKFQNHLQGKVANFSNEENDQAGLTSVINSVIVERSKKIFSIVFMLLFFCICYNPANALTVQQDNSCTTQ